MASKAAVRSANVIAPGVIPSRTFVHPLEPAVEDDERLVLR